MRNEKEDEHEAENEDEHKPTDQHDTQTNLENTRDDTSDHEGTHSPDTVTNSVGGPTTLPVSVSNHAPLPSNQPQLPMYKRDLYTFPWFRGLLGLMTLMLTTLYVFLLAVSAILGSTSGSASLSYHIFFLVPQYWLPVTFGAPICYTVLFVALEDFQTSLATFLEQRLKIPRQHQRRIKVGLPILFGAISVSLEIFLLGYFLVYIRNMIRNG